MSESASKRKRQRIMTLLVLSEAAVLCLHALHIISTTWTVALFFLVIIPFATLKAFADYRSADISD
jgi:hypothetical protein